MSIKDFKSKSITEKEIKKQRKKKNKIDRKKQHLLKKITSFSIPPSFAHFIKLPRSFFNTILSANGYTGKGWKIAFKNSNKLVFRQLESTSNDIELTIGTNDTSFVDSTLQSLNYGQLDDIFDSTYVDLFKVDNWNDADPDNDRFFFLDKAQLESIDSDCDVIYLSQSIIHYDATSVFDFTNIYPDFAQGVFPTIKLEGKDENTTNRFPAGPYPVQTKVIFTLPCPPRWSPGFGGSGH